MTEGLEYAESFIGECNAGGCTRPATVRVYDDFVLCALHHLRREAGEEVDEAADALELIEGWRSVADMQRNDYLVGLLDAAAIELRDRLAQAERRAAQIEQVEFENVPNEEVRRLLGETTTGGDDEPNV